jgi:hypothetical protein
MQRRGQVLTDIKHGDDIEEGEATGIRSEAIAPQAGAAAMAPIADAGAEAVAAAANVVIDEEVTFETPFGYLFADLTDKPEAHLPADDPAKIVAGLKALGDAMIEDPVPQGGDQLQPADNSTIPPLYTYWGQFIDHDLTANTDRDSEISNIKRPDLAPIAPDDVVQRLFNLRQPTVNLDSVYGDGPTFSPSKPTEAGVFYKGVKFRIGRVAKTALPGRDPIRGEVIPSIDPKVDDLDRDLPRIGALIQEGVIKETDLSAKLRSKPNFKQLPLIADARNDENLIVAQLHTAFLRFHNSMVDWVRQNELVASKSRVMLFKRAQQLTRWHHQWLVVNDFLRTVTAAGTVDQVLLGGLEYYKPGGELFMPLEFSVAAYRFGHSMVRAAYDYNSNFGRPGNVIPFASFNLLFTFTGSGVPPFRGDTNELPFNWIIEWDRFVDKGSSIPDHFARKIDTRLAPPLKAMVNQGNNEPDAQIKAILKSLARRNLLRGYLLSLPTGQSVARKLGIKPLGPEELQQGNSDTLNQVLKEHGFLDRTPLWFYILKEAEVKANGNSLGPVGSLIVCETIIGQLWHDPASYLNQAGGWDPSKGARLLNGDLIVTMRDFIRFAGIPA